MSSSPYSRIDFSSDLVPECGLVFQTVEKSIIAWSLNDVHQAFDDLQNALAEGYHAIGFVAYEAASVFDPACQTHDAPEGIPLLLFHLTKEPLAEPPNEHAAIGGPTVNWQTMWQLADYEKAFTKVQQNISSGNSYQLNLTFPLSSSQSIDPIAEYSRLSNAQSAHYPALIIDQDIAVLSASPELFFEKIGDRIVTRPMKGTRRRDEDSTTDQKIAKELAANPKDRAENVMIVDLLRNDLGRIAKAGTVNVDRLFDIEAYPTVWQMTSTVSATLKQNLTLFDIFAALFPCGSVTGAPKIKSMELISEFENVPRGVYCGSIGYIQPNGDAVFNVAIRTMTINCQSAAFHVGSGIVSDSVMKDEYDECLVKAKILNNCQFQLLETMKWTVESGYEMLERHLNRLISAVEHFKFPFDKQDCLKELENTAETFNSPMRIRLLIHADGTMKIESSVFHQQNFQSVKLAGTAIRSQDTFLRYKTTNREVYNQHYGQRDNADDVLLYNERNELCESTMANIALKIDGKWLTPDLQAGLLPGTKRDELIEKHMLFPAILTVDDLKRAESIALFNCLRGFNIVELL